MSQRDFSELSDQELLKEYKKLMNEKIIRAVLIGVLVGITVYSLINKSFGFFTFLPLFFAFLLIKKSDKNEGLMEEMKSRNLK